MTEGTKATLKPTPKIQAVGIGGAAGVVLVFVAGLVNVDVPPEVAAAAVLLLTAVPGFVKKDA
jgi:hypothetical protein